ncbi:MAG: hypothetical protein ACKO15_00865 [Burkholderiales bacterium]
MELADWIRWTKADELHFRSGLTSVSMDITGPVGRHVRDISDCETVLRY